LAVSEGKIQLFKGSFFGSFLKVNTALERFPWGIADKEMNNKYQVMKA